MHAIKKIVLFTQFPLEYGGGTAQYYVSLAQSLSKNPHTKIIITTLNRGMLSVFFTFYKFFFTSYDTNIKKISSSTINSSLNNIDYVKPHTFSQLLSLISDTTVLYTTNNILETLFLKTIFLFKKAPRIIIGFHTPMIYTIAPSPQEKIHNLLYTSWIYRYSLSIASKLHTLNTFDTQYLQKTIRTTRVEKRQTPFHFDLFVSLAKKNPPFSIKRTTAIVWNGRLTKQKGVDDLLFLIKSLSKKNLPAHSWHIIGEGELKKTIKAHTKKYKNVHIYGQISQSHVSSILKCSHIFINTSKWESLPLTILEAQAHGLCCIAYNIPGCNDIIDNKKNGFLVHTKKQFETQLSSALMHSYFKKITLQRFIRKKFPYESLKQNIFSLFYES